MVGLGGLVGEQFYDLAGIELGLHAAGIHRRDSVRTGPDPYIVSVKYADRRLVRFDIDIIFMDPGKASGRRQYLGPAKRLSDNG